MNPLLTKRPDAVRKLVGWATLVLALTLCPSVALAHARLLRSQPSANAALKQTLKTVELWFSEELEIAGSTVVVTDQSGRRVDKNNAGLAEGGKKLQVELEDSGPGTYMVEWKALSTDEHTMKGRFTFTVASANVAQTSPTPAQGSGSQATPQPPQPPTQEMQPHGSEPSQESGSGWSLSIVRCLQYLAMMTLFGGFSLYLFVLAPVLRPEGMNGVDGGESAVGASARRTLLLSWASVALLILTSLAALALQASSVFDKSIVESLSPSVLGQVITKTGYGAAWLLQVSSAAALAVLLFFLGRGIRHAPSEEHRALWWVALAASAVLLVAPGWTGHAAAAAKEYRLAVIADWLHLVAGGFWVG